MMDVHLQLFWIFFKIGWLSFGGVFGVLPELERMIVLEHGWITHDAFLQSYVMSQFLPGPNMAMCPLIGYWVAGLSGAVVSFLGIYTSPLLIMGAGVFAVRRYGERRFFRKLEFALRPLVVGLVAASLWRLWISQSRGLGAEGAWPQQISAIVIASLALYAYRRKWIGALGLIFATGFVWWAVNFLFLW